MTLAALSLGLLTASTAAAQDRLEAGLLYQDLSDGYADWSGVYFLGQSRKLFGDLVEAEVALHNRFGENSFFYRLGNTYTFNRHVYTVASVATSAGGFYNPRFRVDLQGARKWGMQHRFITALSTGYFKSKDAHRDASITAEAIHYFNARFVGQAGVRWNVSSPGRSVGRYQFLTVSHLVAGRHAASFRIGFGNEAYEVLEPLVIYTDFRSWEIAATWHQWVRPGWGFALQGTIYQNDFFTRNGVRIGFFRMY